MNNLNSAEIARNIIGQMSDENFTRKALSLMFGSLERFEFVDEEVELPICMAVWPDKKGRGLKSSAFSGEWNKPIKVHPNSLGKRMGFDPEVVVVNLDSWVDPKTYTQYFPGWGIVETDSDYMFIDEDGRKIGLVYGRAGVISVKLQWKRLSLEQQRRLILIALEKAGRRESEIIPAHPAWVTETNSKNAVRQVRILVAKKRTITWFDLMQQLNLPNSDWGTIAMRAGKDIWSTPLKAPAVYKLAVYPDPVDGSHDGHFFVKPGEMIAKGDTGLIRGTLYIETPQGQAVSIIKGRITCHEYMASHGPDGKPLPEGVDGWTYACNLKWAKVKINKQTIVKARVWLTKDESKENHQELGYKVHGGFRLMDNIDKGGLYLKELFKQSVVRATGRLSNPINSLLKGVFSDDENALVIEGTLGRWVSGMPCSKDDVVKCIMSKTRSVRDPHSNYSSVVFATKWYSEEFGWIDLQEDSALLSDDLVDWSEDNKEIGFSRYPKTSWQSFSRVTPIKNATNGMNGKFIVCHPKLGVYTQGDCDDHALLTRRILPTFSSASDEDPVVRGVKHPASANALTPISAYLKGEYFRSKTGQFTNLLYRSVFLARENYLGKDVERWISALVGSQLDICVQGAKKHIEEPNYEHTLFMVDKLFKRFGLDFTETCNEADFITTKTMGLETSDMILRKVYSIVEKETLLPTKVGGRERIFPGLIELPLVVQETMQECMGISTKVKARNWHTMSVIKLAKVCLGFEGEYSDLLKALANAEASYGALRSRVEILVKAYTGLMVDLYAESENKRLDWTISAEHKARAQQMNGGIAAFTMGICPPVK